jgi:hypothetical protein
MDAIELLKRFPQTANFSVVKRGDDGYIRIHVTSFMAPVEHYNGHYSYDDPDSKLPWLTDKQFSDYPQSQT